MFGTIARMKVKAGKEAEFLSIGDEIRKRRPDGFIAAATYKEKGEANTYWTAVVFRDEASYMKNADDPETDKIASRYQDCLEGPPEWHDGEVLSRETA